jgi:hypothetical protein
MWLLNLPDAFPFRVADTTFGCAEASPALYLIISQND